MKKIKDITIETTIEMVTEDSTYNRTVSIGDNEDLKSYFKRIEEGFHSILKDIKSD